MHIEVSPPLPEFGRKISYHESKVDSGDAEILMNTTYEATPKMKANYLQSVSELNARVHDNRGFDLAVAFHPDEKLSNQEMETLAMEVMNELEFTDTPYVVYRHYDKPHSHFHIIIPSVRQDGTKIKEWKINERAKKTAIKLEKKYSLRVSDRQGKTNVKNDYQVEHYSVARAATKYEGELPIEGVNPEDLYDKSITQIRKDYGVSTTRDLKDFFQSKGLIEKSEREQLQETLQGYRAKTYSYAGFETALLNDGFYVRKLYGDKVVYKLPGGQYQFNASGISKDFTHEGLESHFAKGRTTTKAGGIDPYTKRMTQRIFEQEKTMTGFVEQSYKKGIAIEFSTYKDGRAYGVTFTNIQTGEEFKGSQLGLSLNKIMAKYEPGAKMKNKTPIFYPAILKRAEKFAKTLGFMLERTERTYKKDR